MIICKHLALLANFYSMWLILHVEKFHDFDGSDGDILLWETLCFGRLKVDDFFSVSRN